MDLDDGFSIQEASSAFGNQPLDILINCAGQFQLPTPWHGTKLDSLGAAAGNGSLKYLDTAVEEFTHKVRVSAVGPFSNDEGLLPPAQTGDEPPCY